MSLVHLAINIRKAGISKIRQYLLPEDVRPVLSSPREADTADMTRHIRRETISDNVRGRHFEMPGQTIIGSRIKVSEPTKRHEKIVTDYSIHEHQQKVNILVLFLFN